MDRIIDLSIRVAQLETLKNDVDYVRSQNEYYNERFDFLYKTLNDYLTNFKEIRNQNEIFEVQIKTISSSLHNLTQENHKLKAEIVELKKQIPPKSIVRR